MENDEFYSVDENAWCLILDEGDSVWLDFYCEDEDGETQDDGDSLHLSKDEFEKIERPLSYSILYTLRDEVLGYV